MDLIKFKKLFFWLFVYGNDFKNIGGNNGRNKTIVTIIAVDKMLK